MADGKLTIVVGLPGAGKSTLVRAMRPCVSGLCCGDFHANAFQDSPLVENSRALYHFAAGHPIRKGLRYCPDLAFCDRERRANLQRAIERQIPNPKIEWIYFENATDN